MEVWIMRRAMRRAREGVPPVALVLPPIPWDVLLGELKGTPLKGAKDAQGHQTEITLKCHHGNLTVARDPKAKIHTWFCHSAIDA